MLVHIDTEQTGEKLVNRRLAYVAVSRGRYDAQVYTNDAASLSEALSTDVSKQSALEAEMSSGHAPDEAGTNPVGTPPGTEHGAMRHVGVTEIQHPTTGSWFTGAIPFCVPELVANL